MVDRRAGRANTALTVILWVLLVLLAVLVLAILPGWLAYVVAPLLGVATGAAWNSRRVRRGESKDDG